MTTTRRLAATFLVLLAVAIIALGGFEIWVYWTFKTLDITQPPPVIRVFGRDFRGPNRTMTLAQVLAISTEFAPDILHPSLGDLPLTLPTEPTSAGTIMFPTLIWLQTGPDAYVTYSLAGGP